MAHFGAPFFFKENKIEIVTVSQQTFCLISMICGFGPLIPKHPDIEMLQFFARESSCVTRSNAFAAMRE